MRGYKVAISFSCPANLFSAVRELAKDSRVNFSAVMTRLVRLGITYSELLGEQAALRKAESAKPVEKKAPKPKTPSK